MHSKCCAAYCTFALIVCASQVRAGEVTAKTLRISVRWDHRKDVKENQPSISVSGIQEGNVVVTSFKNFDGAEFSGHSIYPSDTSDEALAEVFARRISKDGERKGWIDLRLENSVNVSISLVGDDGHKIECEILDQSDATEVKKSLGPGSYTLWIRRSKKSKLK